MSLRLVTTISGIIGSLFGVYNGDGQTLDTILAGVNDIQKQLQQMSFFDQVNPCFVLTESIDSTLKAGGTISASDANTLCSLTQFNGGGTCLQVLNDNLLGSKQFRVGDNTLAAFYISKGDLESAKNWMLSLLGFYGVLAFQIQMACQQLSSPPLLLSTNASIITLIRNTVNANQGVLCLDAPDLVNVVPQFGVSSLDGILTCKPLVYGGRSCNSFPVLSGFLTNVNQDVSSKLSSSSLMLFPKKWDLTTVTYEVRNALGVLSTLESKSNLFGVSVLGAGIATQVAQLVTMQKGSNSFCLSLNDVGFIGLGNGTDGSCASEWFLSMKSLENTTNVFSDQICNIIAGVKKEVTMCDTVASLCS